MVGRSADKRTELAFEHLRWGVEFPHDGVGNKLHHLIESLGGEYIHVKALYVLVLRPHPFKDMMYQPGLSYAAWSHEGDIAAILESIDQLCCLLLAVAEILCSEIAVFWKWIV